jgi:hypothetical protein
MLILLTFLVMLGVAYAYWREGLLTAVTMFVNVFIAGLVTFNFFEPLADAIDPGVQGTFLQGYEDALCMGLLFAGTLGILRVVTNNLANTNLDYQPVFQQAGTVLFGLMTGYFVSGSLLCMMQTLPWGEEFLGFQTKGEGIRAVLPPDRVWLALMHRAGAYPFANTVDEKNPDPASLSEKYITFDQYGTFELRYARYRRYPENGDPKPYLGEFDREVHLPRQ